MAVECRFCKSANVVKRGLRKNKVKAVQVYFCKSCRKSFSESTTFARMKNKGELILTALDLYVKNVSLRKIQDHLKQIHGVKVSHVSILKWIRKYSVIFKEFTDKARVNGSGELNADEIMVNVDGKFVWFWNAMDKNTKYLLSNRFSKTRKVSDAKKLFSEAKRKLNESPKKITTDGLFAYETAYNKVFRTQSKEGRPEYFRLVKISEKPDNNVIERLHGSIRERTKIMRGFDKFYSAKLILDLWTTYYNYIREHEALNGLTPAQASGINLPLNGGNKWLELLKLAQDSSSNGVENAK